MDGMYNSVDVKDRVNISKGIQFGGIDWKIFWKFSQPSS